jgi:hypothetical protein
VKNPFVRSTPSKRIPFQPAPAWTDANAPTVGAFTTVAVPVGVGSAVGRVHRRLSASP